jgi:hypothetical protein
MNYQISSFLSYIITLYGTPVSEPTVVRIRNATLPSTQLTDHKVDPGPEVDNSVAGIVDHHV